MVQRTWPVRLLEVNQRHHRGGSSRNEDRRDKVLFLPQLAGNLFDNPWPHAGQNAVDDAGDLRRFLGRCGRILRTLLRARGHGPGGGLLTRALFIFRRCVGCRVLLRVSAALAVSRLANAPPARPRGGGSLGDFRFFVHRVLRDVLDHCSSGLCRRNRLSDMRSGRTSGERLRGFFFLGSRRGGFQFLRSRRGQFFDERRHGRNLRHFFLLSEFLLRLFRLGFLLLYFFLLRFVVFRFVVLRLNLPLFHRREGYGFFLRLRLRLRL